MELEIHTGVFISLAVTVATLCVTINFTTFSHEGGHWRAVERLGYQVDLICLGIQSLGLGWRSDGSGWGFGRGLQPCVEPDPDLYDDAPAVRAVALAGPLGSGLAAIVFMLVCAAVVVAKGVTDIPLLVKRHGSLVITEPVFLGLVQGLVGSVLWALGSMACNLIPTGKTADELSDGMFIFRTEQAIAMKKQALRDQANQRPE